MIKRLLLLVVMTLIGMESPVYAYLDPGTGSIIFQALAATAIAVGLFWNKCINALKNLFRKKSEPNKES